MKALEPRLVALFEQVAKARRGVAICTATRDGLCSVCHVRLRPPVFQQVRHNDSIVQCESCQRAVLGAAASARRASRRSRPVTVRSAHFAMLEVTQSVGHPERAEG